MDSLVERLNAAVSRMTVATLWGDCDCDGFSFGHEPGCKRTQAGTRKVLSSDDVNFAGELIFDALVGITTLQSELLEQARIIGKSAEREERLAARVRELEASNARLRAFAQKYVTAWEEATGTVYLIDDARQALKEAP